MVKIILLIVFSVLAIAAYILCRLMKKQTIVSIIAAGVSVAMLIAVIVCAILIKLDDNKEQGPTNTEPLNVEDMQDEGKQNGPIELDNGKNEEDNNSIKDESDNGNEGDSKEDASKNSEEKLDQNNSEDDSKKDNKEDSSEKNDESDMKEEDESENDNSQDKDSEDSKGNNEA